MSLHFHNLVNLHILKIVPKLDLSLFTSAISAHIKIYKLVFYEGSLFYITVSYEIVTFQ